LVPIHLDPAQIRIGLVGRAKLTARRLAWLRELGAEPLVYSDQPEVALQEASGDRLIRRLPKAEDLAELHVIWVADLEPAEAEVLGAAARAAKVLLNTEDVLPLCDFHTPSIVRRGRLVISAGTGGASPTAAGFVRDRLATAFPETWEDVLDQLAEERQLMKAKGASMAEMKDAALVRLHAAFGPSTSDNGV
jgi:precorrin-2 dehydrogenase/sirohydrochlorin ferrochelatase